ncbi:hypothetical protein NMN47_005046 [Salmonella enterica]|nr:hypothetical protein [Salmonella enterica]EEM7496051.1 hypothetical protein [Salmonella enterica subsp. enterica serovar Bareilly]EGP9304892.1 hypothetical protein [Salmonella enterica]EJL5133853.1 hypothetical protein [Salmonella enterica]
MAKHLSDSDVMVIVNMINSWSKGKLSWDNICKASEQFVGKIPTRQSLCKNKEIAAAYTAKKRGVRNNIIIEPKPATLVAAEQRITSLENKVAQLKEEVRSYKNQFVIWQYNLHRLGVKEHQINAPLPKIDRERSDGQKR